ncbi:MAG: hypothetical protein ACRD18_07065 [Terriglobia bacterium]
MFTITHIIVFAVLKVLLVVLALIYAGLVLTAYGIEGSRYQPRVQISKPARSGERLLVWTGVKLLDGVLRVSRSVFNQLFTASAEIGEWVVDRSSPTLQRKVRSRFL